MRYFRFWDTYNCRHVEYSAHKEKEYVEHIGNGKRQITSASSKFINALELYKEQKFHWNNCKEANKRVSKRKMFLLL